MANWTGNVYSEKKPGARNSAWTMIETSINATPVETDRPSMMPLCTRHGSAVTDNDIYLHEEAATEPNTDDSINATDFSTDTEDTYTKTADPPGYIFSWTSETGIFTIDQDFADHNTKWLLRWNANYTGTPAIGTTAYLRFDFYKRDASNSDTKLFDIRPTGFSGFKAISGNSYYFIPTGSVLTTDRLRIRAYISSETPT